MLSTKRTILNIIAYIFEDTCSSKLYCQSLHLSSQGARERRKFCTAEVKDEDDVEESAIPAFGYAGNMEEEDHISTSAPSEPASLHLSSPSPSQPQQLCPPAHIPPAYHPPSSLSAAPPRPEWPPSPDPSHSFPRPSVIMRQVREVVFDNVDFDVQYLEIYRSFLILVDSDFKRIFEMMMIMDMINIGLLLLVCSLQRVDIIRDM